MSPLDRAFQPQWAGGWAAARVAVGLVALGVHGSRLLAIPDAYGSPDMVFSRGPLHLGYYAILGTPAATAVWAVGVVGALLWLWGGRLAKPGVGLFLVGYWVLMSAEALNIKAYDRLLTWICLGLLLGPIGERGLEAKWRSPVGRWWMLVLFAALYGSTGWLKLLEEPGWLDGSVLALHLVHPWFGSHPLGAWVSGQPWLLAPASWFTLAFECLFPILVLWRRTNPWILLGGVLFHAGVSALMDVGPFGLIAVAAYPVLLHPETARGLLPRWRAVQTGSWRNLFSR